MLHIDNYVPSQKLSNGSGLLFFFFLVRPTQSHRQHYLKELRVYLSFPISIQIYSVIAIPVSVTVGSITIHFAIKLWYIY